MQYKTKVGLGLALAVVTVLGIPAIANLYNYHFSPLARIAKGIEEGDAFSKVHNQMSAYYEANRSKRSVQFTARDTRSGEWTSDTRAPADALFMADESPFDSVQLTVIFHDGRVSEIHLVGD